MSAGPNASDPSDVPRAPAQRPGLFLRVRGHLSLSRVQAIFGLVAALLSIGGALYGYLRPGRAAHTGDLRAVVQDAHSGKAVPNATVEILTPKDALVTTLGVTTGEARSQMKEGPYRLRVTHPRTPARGRRQCASSPEPPFLKDTMPSSCRKAASAPVSGLSFESAPAWANTSAAQGRMCKPGPPSWIREPFSRHSASRCLPARDSPRSW